MGSKKNWRASKGICMDCHAIATVIPFANGLVCHPCLKIRYDKYEAESRAADERRYQLETVECDDKAYWSDEY